MPFGFSLIIINDPAPKRLTRDELSRRYFGASRLADLIRPDQLLLTSFVLADLTASFEWPLWERKSAEAGEFGAALRGSADATPIDDEWEETQKGKGDPGRGIHRCTVEPRASEDT